MQRLRARYDAWRAAFVARQRTGQLRASALESELLGKLAEELSAASGETLAAWNVAVAADRQATGCACGHPAEHHDLTGSCYHIVGCATACGCVRESVTSEE